MTHFPVTHSNLSARHLGLFVAETYALDSVRCRIIKSGINDTYLVESSTGNFVFRVYSLNWRTKTEIQEELRLLTLLHTQGISVSYALPDRHQQYIQTLNAPEGERYGVLFTLAGGEKKLSSPEEAHFQVGQLMAKLHGLTHNFPLERIQYTPAMLLQDSLAKMADFLPACEERQFMESAQTKLLNLFAGAQTDNLRYGAVHLDIWFDNLNIDVDNQITLFDFDFCGNGWLGLDIAFYVMQLYHLERDEKICQSKLDAFYAGYESVSPITDEEKRLVPALGISLYFFYLGIQCERFHNWSNVFLNETYLKRYINLIVKRYWDLHAIG